MSQNLIMFVYCIMLVTFYHTLCPEVLSIPIMSLALDTGSMPAAMPVLDFSRSHSPGK